MKLIGPILLSLMLAGCVSDGTVSGDVVLVNEPGTKVCILPDRGEQQCNYLYQRLDHVTIKLGDKISVRKVLLKGGEVFVLDND